MKFLRYFTRNATTQPTITITMFDDHLDISTTDSPDHPTAITLEPRTIYQGILYKPTVLVAQLSSFLASKKLKKPYTAVHLPPGIDVSSPFLPFFVLQYTLTLAKTGITLVCVTCTSGQRTSDNLLTLLQRPGSHSPTFWVIATLVATGALGTGIVLTQRTMNKQLASLTQQAAAVKTTNSDYENQFKITNKLKADIAVLQEKDRAIQNILHKLHAPNHVLATLAHHTPTALWLNTVTLGRTTNHHQLPQKTKNKTKHGAVQKNNRHITIKGTSQTAQAIAQFLKNLGHRNTDIKHPVLVSVAKEKMPKEHGKKNKHLLYQFVIEGEFVG